MDPVEKLRSSGAAFKKARAAAEAARHKVKPDIIAALRAGVPQKDIVELSGYTRETVRSIARAEGIEAATPAPQDPRAESSRHPGE